MDIDDLLEGADADFPVPTEEWIASYRSSVQDATHGDNEWLADETALAVQEEIAFEPNAGHAALNTEIEAHLCGKHLFQCLVRFIGRRLGVELEDLEPTKLYVRLVSKVPLTPFARMQANLRDTYPDLLGQPAHE